MTIKIYKPSKTAMQSGIGKTKKWLAVYISEVDTVKDSLMGWNSSLDTQTQIKVFFDTKEQAIKWAQKKIISILLKIQKKEKLNQKIMHPTLILIVRNPGHTNFKYI